MGDGATLTEIATLPDGSKRSMLSTPLAYDHWLYQKGEKGFAFPPPMTMRMGTADPRRKELENKVREAAKYAIRGATMHGQEDDMDPDALIQNLIVGLFGYHTPDGLASMSDPDDDKYMNPNPTPPLWEPKA